jgi:NAD+ kinase
MIERVGIVAKVRLLGAVELLDEIARWLDARGVEPVFDTDTAALAAGNGHRRRVPKDELPALVDLVLVLGGDGTLIGMADRIAQTSRDVPILGVNFGGLGFLTEITLPELYASLESALAGTALIEERMMLNTRVVRRDTALLDRFLLNDAVISRGGLTGLIDLSLSVDDQFVARFNADGLIIASPTGSTAYNLSSGGPILHPSVDAFVVTPIAPHILTNRPVVLPASAQVHVQPLLRDGAQQIYLVLDGQSGCQLQPEDRVVVRRADRRMRLVRAATRSYFEVLRQKLKWAER